jgi:hypothetical protein
MLRCAPRFALRLSLLLLALPFAALRGQTPREGMDAVEAQYKKHRQLIGQLLKGEVEADPKNADHAEAVDALAKYATLRFLSDLDQKAPGKMDAIYQNFAREVASIVRTKERGKPLGQMYTHQIIVHSKQVLNEGYPIAKVNVARVLAGLAELGQGELADALTDIVKDPKQPDAVKYWACRGLRNLLAIPVPMPPDPPVVSKAQEEKAVAPLIEFIQRKPPFTSGTPRAEIDGFRVVRREAIRALAEAHNLTAGNPRPALVLLRIAGRDASVVPEPRLDERLEAAIGVARVRSDGGKVYNPDYAAWVLGRFVVDFINAANGNSAATKTAERVRPWKIDAARLGEALELMKADAKGNKYVQEFLNRALPLLAGVESGKQPGPDPTPLNTWLAGNEPTNKELFKDVRESVLKTAAGGGE